MTRWDHRPETKLVCATSWGFGGCMVEKFWILDGYWLGMAPWMRAVEKRHQTELISAAMKKYRRWASEGAG